ncbi:hypothetical protein AMTRI_Chr02g217420 [Amborella trichopoda]
MQYLSIWLLGNNQYTSNIESRSTRAEIKNNQYYFGVKVIAMNSNQLLIQGKGRIMRPLMGHRMHYRRMIITLQLGYCIPLLIEKMMDLNQNT